MKPHSMKICGLGIQGTVPLKMKVSKLLINRLRKSLMMIKSTDRNMFYVKFPSPTSNRISKFPVLQLTIITRVHQLESMKIFSS